MSLPPSPVPPHMTAGPAPVPAQQLSYVAPGVEAVVLTPRALELLRQTRPWVQFIGLVLLVVSALVIAGAAVGGVLMVVQREPAHALQFVLYLVVALVYLFPGIYLRRYAVRLRDALNLRDSGHLEAALEAQKSFWRLVGVLTAIVVGIYALAIVFAVIALALPALFR